jgi:hypothetical protein
MDQSVDPVLEPKPAARQEAIQKKGQSAPLITQTEALQGRDACENLASKKTKKIYANGTFASTVPNILDHSPNSSNLPG